MEYLPKGAQFIRAKFLWEIGLHIAGDPATPYTGNRDLCITVGSGSGSAYKPWLRMSVGSPALAHAVARGELEAAMVNPSALLTQAVRGKGLFPEPLPLVVVANYPSWDRFAIVVHPKRGIRSLAEVAAKRLPIVLSTREDPTHSTRVLIDQIFAVYGFSLAALEGWGGRLQTNGGPGDRRRLEALQAGTVDMVMDEGLALWLAQALAAGYRPLELEPEVLAGLAPLGWRRVVMPAGTYPGLDADYACFDYSGWPLYARADLPEETAYRMVEAIHARSREIVWEDFNARAPFTGMGPLGVETEATPRDVPLHPGSVRWFRSHGFAP
ncbi:MAG TPA: TAXI family TRAP transporter solute-binding subunit [Burkholderiales bacterium]